MATGLVARNFKGTVVVVCGATQSYLGSALPENSWALQATTTPRDGQYNFRIDLRDSDIERIEALRNGGDLQFRMQVMCEISGGPEPVPAQDDVWINVDRAAWIDVMKQFGLDRRLLLEVDFPQTGNAALRTAVERLHRAREEHDAGNHDGVVRECRLALESVKNTLRLDEEIKNALAQYCGSGRRGMSKRARALVLHELAMHYAHLAHHPDEGGETVDFGRRDAAFALAFTSAVVANSTATPESRGDA